MDIWVKMYLIGIPISVVVCGIVWFIYSEHEGRNVLDIDDIIVMCSGICVIWPLAFALTIVVGLFVLLFNLGAELARFAYSKITKGESR